jgi:hypothetical protein
VDAEPADPVITRHDLVNWLKPGCEPLQLAFTHGTNRKGWIYDAAAIQRADGAWSDGTLEKQTFESITKDGLPYTIKKPNRIGFVLHRNGFVTHICFDFDDHSGDGGNVAAADRIADFLGARPVRFSSRSGKGLHDFYELATPIPVADFVAWSKAWGFNCAGGIEAFPKTEKQTAVFMPNEPTGAGDRHISGNFSGCRLTNLPPPPSMPLAKSTLDFMRALPLPGEAIESFREAAYNCGKSRIGRDEASQLCFAPINLYEFAESLNELTEQFDTFYDFGAEVAMRAEAPRATTYRGGSHDDRVFRATEYVNKIPTPVCQSESGSGICDRKLFRVACVCCEGFRLSATEALPIVTEWARRERHLWTNGQIKRKCDDAAKQTAQLGYLLDQQLPLRDADTSPADHFESFRSESAADEVPIDVLSLSSDEPEVIPDEPNALPERVLLAPGFIEKVMDYNLSKAMYSQPELAFAGALSLLSVLTGRKVRDSKNTRTNIYALCLAPVGAGKERAREINQRLLDMTGGTELLCAGSFTSGSSIVEALATSPALLYQCDEINKILRAATSQKASSVLQSIVPTLLEVYSRSNSTYSGTNYTDRRKNKIISQPHFVLMGTAPPEGFWTSINAESVTDGLIPRMMAFEASYVLPPEEEPCPVDPPERLLQETRAWIDLPSGPGNISNQNPTPIIIEHTPEAAERFWKGHLRPIAERRLTEAPAAAALWSRTAEKTAKLALLFAVSRAGPVARVEIDDMERAIQISNWMTRKMLRKIFEHVSENDQEAASKKLMQIIEKAGQGGISQSLLIRKSQKMKPRDRKDMLESFIQAEMIHLEVVSTKTKSKSVYRSGPAPSRGSFSEASSRPMNDSENVTRKTV